jgi:hypothetical protein
VVSFPRLAVAETPLGLAVTPEKTLGEPKPVVAINPVIVGLFIGFSVAAPRVTGVETPDTDVRLIVYVVSSPRLTVVDTPVRLTTSPDEAVASSENGKEANAKEPNICVSFQYYSVGCGLYNFNSLIRTLLQPSKATA